MTDDLCFSGEVKQSATVRQLCRKAGIVVVLLAIDLGWYSCVMAEV